MSNFRKFISMSAVAVLAGTNLLTSLTYAAEAKAWANLQSSDFERNPLQFLMPDQNVYLYAVTAPNDYYVKFNGHGETSGTMGTQTFTYDKEQALSGNAYAKTGYSFSGWNTQENGGGSGYTDKQKVTNLAETGTVDLYAQWNVNSYNITYDLNDKTGSSSGVHTPTPVATRTYEQLLEVTNPTRTGYTFSGWDISGMDTEEHKIGSETSHAASVSGTKATSFQHLRATSGTVEFLAQWSAKLTPYTVKHCKEVLTPAGTYTICETENLSGYTDQDVTPAVTGYNGFTAPETQTEKVKADESTVITYNYARDSYDLTVIAGTGVQTAKGTGTVNTAGATANEGGSDTKKFRFEEPIELSYVLKDGYENAVWSGYSGIASSFTMPYQDITKEVYATAITYTVTGNYHGGTGAAPDANSYVHTYTVEKSLTLPTSLSRDHSIFSGWIEEEGDTPTKNVTVGPGEIGDKVYEAVWDCVAGYHLGTDQCVADDNTEYVVEHYQQELDGNYTLVSADTEHPTGTTDTTATWTGKIYEGFNAGYLSGAVQTISGDPDHPTVVQVRYDRDSYNYTITAPAGGVESTAITSSSASGANSEGSKIKYEDTVTLNADMAPGYEFDYWEVKEGTNPVTVTNSGQIDGATFKMPAGAVTITPHLKKTDYTITMDPYGGTITSGNTITYNVETSGFNLPTPTRDNSVFEGWKGTGDTTTPATAVNPLNIAKGSTGDRTYVAVWGCKTGYTLDGNKCVANTYTVSINYKDEGNDKGDRVETETFTYDDVNPTPIPNPTQSGYTFAGWTVSGYNEDTAEVDGNKLVSPTSGTVFKNLTPTSGATVTLVANWTANTDTRYEVHHYYSDLSGNYVASGVDYLSGITNDTVTFDPDRLQNYSGFVYSGGYAVVTTSTTRPAGAGVASTNIKKDGTTVIDLYYDRVEYTVKTAHDTGAVATHGDETYKYGATVEVSADVKAGYHFVKWEKKNSLAELQGTQSTESASGS